MSLEASAAVSSRRRRVAWALFGVSVAVVLAAGAIDLRNALADDPTPNTVSVMGDAPDDMLLEVDRRAGDVVPSFVQLAIIVVVASGLGALVYVNQPANASGPILLGIGLLAPWLGAGAPIVDWVYYGNGPGGWLGVPVAYLSWIGFFGALTLLAVFTLRFPTGEYLSAVWRGVGWLAVAGGLLVCLSIFDPAFFVPDPVRDVNYVRTPGAANPLGVEGATGLIDSAFGFGVTAVYVALLAGVGSLIVRFLRSEGEVRQQLKWVGFTTATVAVIAVVSAQLNELGGGFSFFFDNVLPPLIMLIPASIAVALFRYRLYDIDVVINKALVYAALAVLIAAVFTLVVFLPFLLFDVQTDRGAGSLALPLLATVILVAVIQPVRQRAQKAADRLVYGHRASPYEALSEFSATVAGSFADEELLERMAEILAEGTGAESTTVWIVEGSQLRPEATWPASAGAGSAVSLEGFSAGDLPGSTRGFVVRHQGELLGALSLAKRPGDPLRPIEEKLARDLASQAGVVLRNFRLTTELLHRVDQLRISRQRIVAAQDEERRRLERDLHDGAQQQLVALKIKLNLALRAAEPDQKDALVEAVLADTDDAIANLRELARGIYPPLLEQRGLVAALRAQAEKAAVPTEVVGDAVGRYHQDVEAAVYFCTLEALQNVAKYAAATSARVSVAEQDGRLVFAVADDGAGFDLATVSRGSGLQNMEDRLEALGGTLSIASAPGRGTTVGGSVPVSESVAD